MFEELNISNSVLQELGLEKKSVKTMLDFIELYKKTENKEILNSLLSDILEY
ncbi:MAG: hypothetical protein GW809_07380 [Bacteroidetes bacterium]|nr:hypothetical protein [Bacteroidota bacterium]